MITNTSHRVICTTINITVKCKLIAWLYQCNITPSVKLMMYICQNRKTHHDIYFNKTIFFCQSRNPCGKMYISMIPNVLLNRKIKKTKQWTLGILLIFNLGLPHIEFCIWKRSTSHAISSSYTWVCNLTIMKAFVIFGLTCTHNDCYCSRFWI